MKECFYMFPRIRTAARANPLNSFPHFSWSCLIVADIPAALSSMTPLCFSCYQQGLRLNSPVNAKRLWQDQTLLHTAVLSFFLPLLVFIYEKPNIQLKD